MSEGNRGNGPQGQAPPTGDSAKAQQQKGPQQQSGAQQSNGQQPAQPPPSAGQGDTPVWDPPAPAKPKMSLRDRLGLGKKGEEPEGTPPSSATSAPPAGGTAQPAKPQAANPPTGQQPNAAASGSPTPQAAGQQPAPKGQQPANSAPKAAPAQSGNPAQTAPAQTGDTKQPANAAQQGKAPQGKQNPATARPAESAAETTQVKPSPWQRPQDTQTAGVPANKAGGPQAKAEPGATEKTSVIPAVAPTGAAPAAAPADPEAKPAPAASSSSAEEAAAKPKAGQPRRTRKARLRLSRLDPWSVMKTSFLFSIAAGIMLVVAVYVVWAVIGRSGLFESVNEIVQSVVSTPGDTTPFQIEQYVNTQKVMGVTALLACVDVVIFTALATLGSFLYNLAATMLGGLEVTLAED